jgi:MFS family permease
MRGRLSNGQGFWVVAAVFLVVTAFSTVPTPLYGLYQRRDGFATYVITVIFAAYAVGVMTSLYLAGHVSDWLGRRRLLFAALALELVSVAIFLIWREVPALVIARLFNGAGVGILTPTATAYLAELRTRARPGEGSGRATLVSTVVNMGGLATGPLVAGFLSQYVAAPLTVPYAVFAVLLLGSAGAVLLVPETVASPARRPAYHPQRVKLPAGARGTFFAAVAGAFGGFAIMGLFTSLAPSFLSGTLHQTSRLVAGAVTFIVLGAGALAQVLMSGQAVRRQLQVGVSLMLSGLVGVALAGELSSLALLVVGGVASGAGAGLVFRNAISTAAGLAEPEAVGEVLAAAFLGAFAGLIIPVLLVGVAVTFWTTATTLLVFSAAVFVLVLWSGRQVLAHHSAT